MQVVTVKRKRNAILTILTITKSHHVGPVASNRITWKYKFYVCTVWTPGFHPIIKHTQLKLTEPFAILIRVRAEECLNQREKSLPPLSLNVFACVRPLLLYLVGSLVRTTGHTLFDLSIHLKGNQWTRKPSSKKEGEGQWCGFASAYLANGKR